jgi:RNA polymerase II subunit A small phosphatase-like protein
MAKGTGDNDAAAAAGGGSSRASNGGYSGGASASNGGARRGKSSSASFGTFHYDDPAHPADKPILPPVAAQDKGKLCLVLDLDETLVHSSFRAVPNPDYIIPVKIEDVVHQVYVCKRPGVDEFMRRVGERYEIIIYTASLNKYADPLLDMLDKHRVIRHRLFRESCTQYQGNYVKNLSLLGRDLSTCIIVDNSPLSYLFHPENAIGCISWIDQKDDDELRVIADFCERIEEVDDIRLHMRSWRQGGRYNPKTISG